MPKVSVSIPHQLTADEAMAKAKPAMDKMANDFQGSDVQTTVDGNRADFSFKSLGFTIKGALVASDNDLNVDVDLPFAAMMFKDKAEAAIRKNLTRALES